MNDLIPMEFENKRILTTEQLAEVYETTEKRISENFNYNKERFEEGKHFYLLQGEELKTFKNQYGNCGMVNKNASQLYLWTERGADRHCKMLGTDKAWDQFDTLEETYFNIKNNKPHCMEDVLIQSLQEMKAVRLQLEETKIAVQETKEEVQVIRDTISINPKAEWRKQTNTILNKIGRAINDYKVPKDEAYIALKERGNCRPKILINNLQARALMQGMAKSKVESLNILDVLENEPRLKEIYISIIREMAIKYKVTWV